MKPIVPSDWERDAPLLKLLVRVARRADVLARWHNPGREVDRALWLRAEQEVFERSERNAPNVVAR